MSTRRPVLRPQRVRRGQTRLERQDARNFFVTRRFEAVSGITRRAGG